MRIHSDTLTATDVQAAANFAARAGHGKVYVDSLTVHGSRSRQRALDVKLIGDGSHGRHRTNNGGQDYAATWDSWGWFFAFLFSIDPRMTCRAYDGAGQFQARTHGDYEGAMASAAVAL